MRVLTDQVVRAALPAWNDVIDLAEAALLALARDEADVPPKPAVHTNPDMFVNAMPAAHPGRNLLGCKWISIVPANAERGLASINGIMIVNDGTTGIPECVMPATELTAVRTAAVTGACVRALGDGGPVSYLGTGVQCRSHLEMLSALGYREVTVWGRRREAVQEIQAWAAAELDGLQVIAADSLHAAAGQASVLITGLAIGLTGATRVPVDLVRPDALMLPLDYASVIGPDVARASVLAADDVRQFESTRTGTTKLDTYPEATLWSGDLIAAGRPEGRVVVSNLGSGLADVFIADAVARRAAAADLGQVVAW